MSYISWGHTHIAILLPLLRKLLGMVDSIIEIAYIKSMSENSEIFMWNVI